MDKKQEELRNRVRESRKASANLRKRGIHIFSKSLKDLLDMSTEEDEESQEDESVN